MVGLFGLVWLVLIVGFFCLFVFVRVFLLFEGQCVNVFMGFLSAGNFNELKMFS